MFFSDEDLKLIKGCLLTTKEFFNMSPIKSKDVKNKIKQINDLYNKILDLNK